MDEQRDVDEQPRHARRAKRGYFYILYVYSQVIWPLWLLQTSPEATQIMDGVKTYARLGDINVTCLKRKTPELY